MLSGQLAHERALPNRRKSNKADAGNTSPGDVKSGYVASGLHSFKAIVNHSQPPPPPLEDGVNNSLRSLASFAFNWPKWYDVALFFWVSIEDGVSLSSYAYSRQGLYAYLPFRPRHL